MGDPVRAEHLERAEDLARRAPTSKRRLTKLPRTAQVDPWSWSTVAFIWRPTAAMSAP